MNLCGFHTTIDNLKLYNCPLQFFLSNPYKFFSFNFKDKYKISEIRKTILTKQIFIRSKFIINISKTIPNLEKVNIKSSSFFSLNVIYKELKLLEELGIKNSGVVFSLSKGYNETKEESLLYTAKVLSLMAKCLFNEDLTNNFIIIETSGNVNHLGSSVEELSYLWKHMEDVGKDRVRFCINTKHIFLSGYDISTARGMMEYFYRFEKFIGLDKILLFHLNDSDNKILSTSREENKKLGCKIFPEFSFLFNDDSSEEEIRDQLKLKKATNLNILKSISEFLKINVIFENKSFGEFQVEVFKLLTPYKFDKIINNIYYRIISSEFKKLLNIYRVLSNKKVDNCKRILSLLNELKDYSWCDIKFEKRKIEILPSSKIHDLKCFGAKTTDKIVEIILNKKMLEIERIEESEYYKNILNLIKILDFIEIKEKYSMAKTLIKNNIKTVNEMLASRDFFSVSQKKIIKIFNKLETNISRDDIKEIEAKFKKSIDDINLLRKKNEIEMFFIKPHVENINILLISDDPNDRKLFINHIKKRKTVVDISESSFLFKYGEKFFKIIVTIKPFDLKSESLICLSHGFNKLIRKVAKLKGITITDDGLKKKNITNERNFFNILNIEYKQRNFNHLLLSHGL